MSGITVPTNFGLQHIANASAGGFLVDITDFKVTQETNFTPNIVDNALVGSVVYSGKIISIEALSRGLVKFVCQLPAGVPTTGQWQIGEIGIYLESGQLLAHGRLDPVYPKTKDLGLRINVFVTAINLGAVVNVNIASAISIPSYPFINVLPDPVGMGENALSVLDGFINSDGSYSPLLASRYGAGGSLWGYNGLDRVFYGNPVSINNSEIVLSDDAIADFNDNEILTIQVTAGNGHGQSRHFRYRTLDKKMFEADGRPLTGVDATSKIAVWRTPQAEIESLRRKLELYIGNLRWADTYEWNQLADRINKIVATPSGDTYPEVYGYNETPLPILSKGTHPSHANWALMYEYLQVFRMHQVGNGLPVGTVVNDWLLTDGYHGAEFQKTEWPKFVAEVLPLEANHARYNVPFLVSQIPDTGTRTRTTEWSSSRTHQINIAFGSLNALKGFFNAGGSVSMGASLANGGTQRASDWAALLSNLTNSGGMTLTAGGVTASSGVTNNPGIYTVLKNSTIMGGTGWTTIYSNRIRGAATNQFLEYRAQAQVLENGELVIVISFDNMGGGNSYAYAYVPLSVTGTLKSVTALTKPASTYVKYPVMPFPPVVSGGTL